MGLTTPARNPALSLPAIDAALREIRQEYPELRRTGFTNLVQNGTFASDTAWTKGTGWTISGGVATKTAGTAAGIEQAIEEASIGFYGLLGLDLTRTAGDLYLRLGGAANQHAVSATATYSRTLRSEGINKNLSFVGSSGFAGTVDNVSLWEADPADNAPWLRLPKGFRVMEGDQIHPLASVQRDADMLHAVDFTEIWRNGQVFIKPASAPGVSTRFSIVSYKAI